MPQLRANATGGPMKLESMLFGRKRGRAHALDRAVPVAALALEVRSMKSFEPRTLDMRKLLATIAVWYFIFQSGSGAVVQVGPFATQAACNNYRTTLSDYFGYSGSSCFSTTAKE
jgi:hypothetical protein